jgi:AraC-like DNA-binding protein
MLRKCLIETTDPVEFSNFVTRSYRETKVWPIGEQSGFDIRLQLSSIRNLKLAHLSSPSGYRYTQVCTEKGYFGLFLVQSGSVRLNSKDAAVEVAAGTAHLRLGGERLEFEASAGSTLLHAEIPIARYASLASNHAAAPEEQLGDLESVIQIEAHGLSIIEDMAMVLIGDQSDIHPFIRSPFAALRVKEAIIAAFIEYWPSHGSAGGMAAYGNTSRRAISWLHEHLQEDFTMEDVAKAIGVSLRGMQQAFKDDVGTSPINYVQRLRLQRVHQDLLDPSCGMSVSEVAHEWGFRHLGYFAARYRTLYGEAPSETRRKAQTSKS